MKNSQMAIGKGLQWISGNKKAPQKAKTRNFEAANFRTSVSKKNCFRTTQVIYRSVFLLTDVGQLYQAIPFEDLEKSIAVPKHAMSGKGRKPWFDVRGGIGLHFLKHYLRLSDAQLIERINTDWSLPYFAVSG